MGLLIGASIITLFEALDAILMTLTGRWHKKRTRDDGNRRPATEATFTEK